MASAATGVAVAGVALPRPFVSRRPPLRLLTVSASFRRLSLPAASHRSAHLTSLVARSNADGEAAASIDADDQAPAPEAEAEAEAEAVAVAVADADAEALAEVEEKPTRNFKINGDVIGMLNKKFIEEAEKVKVVPDLRSGDIVELRMQRPNKRRLTRFRGIVISKQSSGLHTTIRLRRIISGIGVEIIFPVYSPLIKEIRVVRHRKVRRAKLYYLKEKLPRFSTFK